MSGLRKNNMTIVENTEEIWMEVPAEYLPETKHKIFASDQGRVRHILKNKSFKYMGSKSRVGYIRLAFDGYKSCGDCEECAKILDSNRIASSTIKRNEKVDNLIRTKSKTRCFSCKRFSSHFQVHRIIANLFIPRLEGDGFLIDHISGDKSDNRATNLRWCTDRQNKANTRSRKNISMNRKSFIVKFEKKVNGNRTSESKSFKKLVDALEYRNKRDIELNGEFATEVTIEQLDNLTKA